MLAAGPTAAEEEIVGRHFVYLQELVERGTVKLAGRTMTTDEHAFGIVLLHAASEEDAERIMREDPAVKEGVMRAELFPFRVALNGMG